MVAAKSEKKGSFYPTVIIFPLGANSCSTRKTRRVTAYHIRYFFQIDTQNNF
jgi:hypothetical protein